MLDCTPDTSLTYTESTLYSVTIQPNDQYQFFRTPERYSKFHELYDSKFKRLFQKFKIRYQFRIELSEPIGDIDTNGPRLHLHGLLELKTTSHVFLWLCDLLPDLLHNGRVTVHQIDSLQKFNGWLAYISKQQNYIPKSGLFQSGTNVIHDLTQCHFPSPGGDEPS